MDRLRLRLELEDLFAAYAACLDDGELERWPEFFTDDCRYEIIPRENFERRLPLAVLRCESKGMLIDRVAALRHLVSGVRIVGIEGGIVRAHANYAVLQTLSDEHTTIFNAGRYLDRVVRSDGVLKLAERLCVYDSVLVPGSLVYPI